VVPTDPGQRLYQGAQRLLALEEQLVSEITRPAHGPLTGTLDIGASTGPAAIVLPLLLCEFQQANPRLQVELAVHDTQTVVSLVAERDVELGIVGAARKRRTVSFEPFFSDEVILVCPPGHAFAGRTIGVDELAGGHLIVMQDGAGVRQLVEDELRRHGRRLRDLHPRLTLGLQESVRSAVQAGHGVTFISRRAVTAELDAGALAEVHVEDMDLQRQISIARAANRTPSRAADTFVAFARERLT
jgi:DNA-binding transcriptional LysR family regulator